MLNKLIDCKEGNKVKIAQISAGHGAIVNLMNLGLSIGNIVEVQRKSPLHGPVIVSFQNTEIAIGYGLAEKILVEGS